MASCGVTSAVSLMVSTCYGVFAFLVVCDLSYYPAACYSAAWMSEAKLCLGPGYVPLTQARGLGSPIYKIELTITS